MKKFWLTVVCLFVMLCAPLVSFDQIPKRIDLVWTPNREGDLSGYKVYRGINSCADASLMYLATVPAPTAAYTDIMIPRNTQVVCYAVTAFDTARNESLFSNKVSKTVNLAPSAPTAPSFR